MILSEILSEDGDREEDNEPRPKLGRSLSSNDGYLHQRDYMSDLPDEVAELIMSRLTLRDRVRASAVSRKWNKMCLSPSMILLTLRSGLVKDINNDAGEDFCPAYRNVFINNVNQFLASLRGNRADSFCLRFCLSGSSTDDIDGWIDFAVRTSVRRIYISFFCSSALNLRTREFGEPEFTSEVEEVPYVIGSERFHTPRCNLKTLELSGCNLGPDLAKHLGGLTLLRLSFSALAEYDLQTMFFGLPKLVELIFSRCTLPQEINLCCLPLLKRVNITHCRGIERIHLSNHYLYYLSLHAEGVVECNLAAAPKLSIIGYAATKLTMPYIFEHIPRDAPKLNTACISYHGESDDCIPDYLRAFSGVRLLKWKFVRNARLGIVKLFRILKAFPALTELRILKAKNLEGNNEFTNVNYKAEHLRLVTISWFCGTSGQIDFVVYLLKHATMLKQLSIIGQKSWSEGPRQEFLSKINAFRKDVRVILT